MEGKYIKQAKRQKEQGGWERRHSCTVLPDCDVEFQALNYSVLLNLFPEY